MYYHKKAVKNPFPKANRPENSSVLSNIQMVNSVATSRGQEIHSSYQIYIVNTYLFVRRKLTKIFGSKTLTREKELSTQPIQYPIYIILSYLRDFF